MDEGYVLRVDKVYQCRQSSEIISQKFNLNLKHNQNGLNQILTGVLNKFCYKNFKIDELCFPFLFI